MIIIYEYLDRVMYDGNPGTILWSRTRLDDPRKLEYQVLWDTGNKTIVWGSDLHPLAESVENAEKGIWEAQQAEAGETRGQEAVRRSFGEPGIPWEDRTPGDGDTPGGTGEGPGDGSQAEAGTEATGQEAQGGTGCGCTYRRVPGAYTRGSDTARGANNFW